MHTPRYRGASNHLSVPTACADQDIMNALTLQYLCGVSPKIEWRIQVPLRRHRAEPVAGVIQNSRVHFGFPRAVARKDLHAINGLRRIDADPNVHAGVERFPRSPARDGQSIKQEPDVPRIWIG